jgi:hypothetical protein
MKERWAPSGSGRPPPKTPSDEPRPESSPSPTAEPTPSPSEAPSPEPSTEPSPEPSPTVGQAPEPPEVVPECPVYRVDVRVVGDGGNRMAKEIYRTGEFAQSCVEEEFSRALAHCSKQHKSGDGDLDDCIAAGCFLGSKVYSKKRTSWTPRNLSRCGANNICYSGSFFLDASCNDVKAPPNGTKTCSAGVIAFIASPLALLLSDGYDVDRDVRLSNSR